MALLPLPSDTTAYVELQQGRPTSAFYNWLQQVARQLGDEAALSLAARLRASTALTIYVSPTGNNSNDGLSVGQPMKTITAALLKILTQYDMVSYKATIQLANGTYNFATTGDSGFYTEWHGVGGDDLPMVRLRGDPTTPSNVILDPGGGAMAGINLPPSSQMVMAVDGVQFQNFNIAINNQALSGQVFLGNTRFLNIADRIWNAEGGSTIISGSLMFGSNPTISIKGASAQLMYIGANSQFDPNGAAVNFESGTSFSYAVMNVAVQGRVTWYNNATGTNPTGTRFFIEYGGAINAWTDTTASTALGSGSMPGTVGGMVRGGFYNNIGDHSWATSVSGLWTPDGGGRFPRRIMVVDATSTTFGSIVAGGGSNMVPVYWDFVTSNWRIG